MNPSSQRPDRCGARYLQLDTNHSPFYSAHEEFAEMLLEQL
ncbi:MAG: hypothetical protein ACYDHH_18225 [Solirubrobacteraceae bacterium]